MPPLTLPPDAAESLLGLVEDFAFVYAVAGEALPRLEWANRSFEVFSGRPYEAWRDMGAWFTFIHADDRTSVLDAFARANRGAAVEFDFRLMLTPDGRWHRACLRPLNQTASGEMRVCGVVRDVSHLHGTVGDADLRARLEQMREAFDALPIGVWFVGPDGHVQDVNRAGRELWGGVTGPVHVHDAEAYARFKVRRAGAPGGKTVPSPVVAALERGESSVDQDVEIELPDGSPRVLQTSTLPIHAPDGSVSGAIVLNVDVTAARRLEAQMRQGQRMESIGRMAGGIAHDFNNLLTVIVGCAELSLQFGKGGESTAEWEETLAAARRAAELTKQLLAFSRQQPVAARIVDLSSVVHRVEGLLRRVIGEDVTLVVDTAASTLPVNVDPGQFEQILINLAANARDAMADGGTVTVRTSLHVVTPAEARRRPGLTAGPKVRLSVSDTGVGIPEDIRNRIFEPFFTTKVPGKGTGLGLAMCYGTVKQAGGYIGVESTVGKGTTFYIYLPVVAGDVVDIAEEAVTRTEELPMTGARVLLVEDEAAVADLTRRSLEAGGYSVVVANSGTEALQRLAALREPVDLLLTDVVMPDMRGTALAKRARALMPDLPVMFVSGYPGPLEEEFHSARLLPKPFSPGDLLKEVAEALKD